MRYGYVSITGKVRDSDEDSILAISCEAVSEGQGEGRFLGVVADGMGGGEYGEVASRIATVSFRNILGPYVLRGKCIKGEIREQMEKSFEKANSEILQFAKRNNLYLMGTTATAAFVCGDSVVIGNMGDSRAYLFDENGKLLFRTKDHSRAMELVEKGEISEKDSRLDYRRNELTRFLGMDFDCSPDFYELHFTGKESILLCCDGLWGSMDEEEIGELVVTDVPEQIIANEMANRANINDGSDNISLILVRS